MPDAGVIREHVGDGGEVEGVDVAALLEIMNERVELLFDRDHQIGHAYFLNVSSLEDLREVFLDRVIPLLQEYFYGDWAKVAWVLGCPFDPESGKPTQKNVSPMLRARLLDGSGLEALDHFVAARVRCEVNPAFERAEQLASYFDAVTAGTGVPNETADAE